MTILIFIIASYILLNIALFFVFPKANVEAWKAFVPVLNMIEWCKIIGRPSWWAFLLFIPIVNFFIFAGMCIDLVKSFGIYKFIDSALAVIYAPGILLYIGLANSIKYVEPAYLKETQYKHELEEARKSNNVHKFNLLKNKSPYSRSGGREWVESIVFAVFAASFIRMFLVEAFVIPTPSMEGSLNVGDFLFVSKMSYGIRTPMTVAMFPLLHNRLPIANTESYLTKPALPYFRLPALSTIKRDDPFVFNWPVGDSVYIVPQRSFTVQQVEHAQPGIFANYPSLKRQYKNKEYIVRPIDKKDHYIKRCVAVAGDSLEVRDAQLYINGEAVKNPKHLQLLYEVRFNNKSISKKTLNKWGIDEADIRGNSYRRRKQRVGTDGLYFIDKEQVENLTQAGVQVVRTKHKIDPELFPSDPKHFNSWSVDDFGPIYIPKQGATVKINPENIALYTRVIGTYENNDLKVKNGQIFINGTPATEYTFKQNYYWAMGDNRHNSEDSRSWGYVPFDHVVGKPLFIWFSTKDGNIANGINWDRIFKPANAE